MEFSGCCSVKLVEKRAQIILVMSRLPQLPLECKQDAGLSSVQTASNQSNHKEGFGAAP